MDTTVSKLPEADIVAGVYRAILQREPDHEGLKDWSAYLRQGGNLEGMLRGMLGSVEFAEKFQAFHQAYLPPANRKFIFDHSQYGEVAKLVKLMAESTARHKIIVDVGARGRERSNSYDLLPGAG